MVICSGWGVVVQFGTCSDTRFQFNTSKVYNEVSSEFEPTGDWKRGYRWKYNKKGYPVSSFWAFRFAGLNPENGGPLFDMSGAATNGETGRDSTWFMSGSVDPDLTAD